MCFSNIIIIFGGLLLLIWGFVILKSSILVEHPDDDDNLVIALMNAVPFWLTGSMFLMLFSNQPALGKFFVHLKPSLESSQFMVELMFIAVAFAAGHFKFIVPWRLNRWAKKRGMRLISYKANKSRTFSGIFTGRSKYQSFYTLEIEEEDGSLYLADVTIGSYWGTNPNKFDVSWEKISE